MLIDCDTCTAGPRACGDCIVTHLLSVQPAARPAGERGHGHDHPGTDRPATDLTASEIAAVGVLSAGGLVPPLRLVTGSRPGPARRGGPPAQAPGATSAGSQAG